MLNLVIEILGRVGCLLHSPGGGHKGRVGRWRDGSEEWVSHHATSAGVDITARATDHKCSVVVTSRQERGRGKLISELPWLDHELDAER